MKAVIIGTAGRTQKELLTLRVWNNMVARAMELVPKGAHGISGGAAWSDHVAVALHQNGHLSYLTLHLPAPISNGFQFIGGYKSAASAANYYHSQFSHITGVDTIRQITHSLDSNTCNYTVQDPDLGFKAMFIRNALVAKELSLEDMCLAYTWDRNGLSDSGTKNTWDQIKALNKVHVSLLDCT